MGQLLVVNAHASPTAVYHAPPPPNPWRTGMTCDLVQLYYGVAPDTFQTLNPGLPCDNLPACMGCIQALAAAQAQAGLVGTAAPPAVFRPVINSPPPPLPQPPSPAVQQPPPPRAFRYLPPRPPSPPPQPAPPPPPLSPPATPALQPQSLRNPPPPRSSPPPPRLLQFPPFPPLNPIFNPPRPPPTPPRLPSSPVVTRPPPPPPPPAFTPAEPNGATSLPPPVWVAPSYSPWWVSTPLPPAPPPPPRPTGVYDPANPISPYYVDADEAVTRHNYYRDRHSVVSLTWSSNLAQAAQVCRDSHLAEHHIKGPARSWARAVTHTRRLHTPIGRERRDHDAAQGSGG